MRNASSELAAPRLFVRSVIGFGIFFGLLFGGAGTFAWPEGWVYILMQSVSSVAMVLWLKKYNPELLRERMDAWKRLVKTWDKVIMVLFMVVSVPFFVLPGLDAVRFQWTGVPLALVILGFAGLLISSGLIFWVVVANPYSSAVVEIQTERGHTVVSSGPYRFVRHPMYVGAIGWFLCTPLALGSLLTYIPGLMLATLIVVRTYLEDKTLHRELAGYPDYAANVRYRLVPGIW
jgi:protein-S-isoprenylcysteine O-methyltransferase Ste14